MHKEHFIPNRRTCAIFEALFDQPLAEGRLATAVEFCAQELGEVEEVIKQALGQARVGHFDETGMHVAGQRGWLHSASTAHWTHYAYHEKRGSVATQDIGILPQLSGRACDDGFQAYMKYACAHSLCNAHHLRELSLLEEHSVGARGAHEMKALLLEIKKEVDAAKQSAAKVGWLASGQPPSSSAMKQS